MSNTSTKSTVAVYTLGLLPRPITLILLLFILTGNCESCGFDRDYICAGFNTIREDACP